MENFSVPQLLYDILLNYTGQWWLPWWIFQYRLDLDYLVTYEIEEK
jgi:hypothetical protein